VFFIFWCISDINHGSCNSKPDYDILEINKYKAKSFKLKDGSFALIKTI